MADRLRFNTAKSGRDIYMRLRNGKPEEWSPCTLKVNRPEGDDKKVEIKLPVAIKNFGKEKKPQFVSMNGDQVYRTRLRFSDGNTFVVDITFGVVDWDLEGAVISFDWKRAASVLDHIEGC